MPAPYRAPLEAKQEPKRLRLVPYPRAILVALAVLAAIAIATFAARTRRLEIDCARPSDAAPWTCTRVDRRLGVITEQATFALADVRELTLAPVDDGSVAVAKTPRGPIEIARFPSHETSDANVAVVHRLGRALEEPGARRADAIVETRPWSAIAAVVALFVLALPILGPIRASRLRIDPSTQSLRIDRARWFGRVREEVPLARVRHVAARRVKDELTGAVVLRLEGGEERVVLRSHLPAELLEAQAEELAREIRVARELGDS